MQSREPPLSSTCTRLGTQPKGKHATAPWRGSLPAHATPSAAALGANLQLKKMGKDIQNAKLNTQTTVLEVGVLLAGRGGVKGVPWAGGGVSVCVRARVHTGTGALEGGRQACELQASP